MKTQKQKLILYAVIFASTITFDGAKYLSIGGPNIINWQSFVHPLWVILAMTILVLNIYFWREAFFRFSFILYFLVLFAAFVNQYLPFSETLTYNCMLFNMVFASIYFLTIPKRI